jgi:hypothetical protein
MVDKNGRNIGMFYWSWEFHNAVNSYLKKYQPTFEEAFNYYIDGNNGVCNECTEGHSFTKSERRTVPPFIKKTTTVSPGKISFLKKLNH